MFVKQLKEYRETAAAELSKYCERVNSRVKISFRADIYESISVLAKNWNAILGELEKAEHQKDYYSFVEYMRSVCGLGVNNKK